MGKNEQRRTLTHHTVGCRTLSTRSTLMTMTDEPTADRPERPATRWATRDEVAAYLRVGRTTVGRLGAEGHITRYRIGQLTRYDLDQVDAYMLASAAATATRQ